jgi:hypothetical protein
VTGISFVIPVRHPANARDWSQLKANLTQTVRSIAAQQHGDWRGVIVANTGSDLPELPERFSVAWVEFAPNAQHDQTAGLAREDFRNAFRIDKGRRVLKGMLHARDSRFFMIVDDDDFVSARICGHAAAHPQAHGWTVDDGYVWSDGGQLLLQHPAFNQICGTSLIVRADAYGLPERFEDASPEYMMTMLGSHIRLHEVLARQGTPLQRLPFHGAVYRVGQSGSHSQAPKIMRQFFLNREALRRPRQLLRRASGLRWLTPALRREFFG